MNITVGRFTSRLMSLGLICFVLFGCVSAADGITKRRVSTTARLGRPFTLRAGRQIAVQGQKLRIRFAEVTQDSRCPVDVTCVWAGNASVRLEVTTNGRSEESLTLNTANSPSLANEAAYEGFKVKLVGLSPAPHSKHRIAPGNYVATLVVTRD
jgi:hypothetical protein